MNNYFFNIIYILLHFYNLTIIIKVKYLKIKYFFQYINKKINDKQWKIKNYWSNFINEI